MRTEKFLLMLGLCKRAGAVIIGTPMDVKSLQENFPEFEQNDLQIATFGPAAAKAVEAAGLRGDITAPTPEAPSIAKALMLHLQKENK